MFGDVFSHMLHGFTIALTFKGLAMVTIGCVAGTIIGALPGLGPITAIAVMIPIGWYLLWCDFRRFNFSNFN